MIGRMYRPLKILNIPGKRGFNILNKYKSNFGGTFKFETDVYLDYNAEEQTEVVQVEFKNINLPIYMEKGIRQTEESVVSTNQSRTIESFRKLVRPTKISSKDVLDYVMKIESPKGESENDILEMNLVPVMVEGQEYMKIEVACETPVIIHSTTTVKIAE
jgi:hypothetical protein